MQKFKLKHVVLNFKFGSLDKANQEQGIFVMLDKGCKQEKEKKRKAEKLIPIFFHKYGITGKDMWHIFSSLFLL